STVLCPWLVGSRNRISPCKLPGGTTVLELVNDGRSEAVRVPRSACAGTSWACSATPADTATASSGMANLGSIARIKPSVRKPAGHKKRGLLEMAPVPNSAYSVRLATSPNRRPPPAQTQAILGLPACAPPSRAPGLHPPPPTSAAPRCCSAPRYKPGLPDTYPRSRSSSTTAQSGFCALSYSRH